MKSLCAFELCIAMLRSSQLGLLTYNDNSIIILAPPVGDDSIHLVHRRREAPQLDLLCLALCDQPRIRVLPF